MRKVALRIALVALSLAPSPAFAQGEVIGVIGGMLGGDLNNLVQGTSSIGSAFDNGPLWGVRAGYFHGFIGGEMSYVYSPSGVSVQAPGGSGSVDAKVQYLEGNALFMFLPGPVQPFLTAGAGWHSYDFQQDDKIQKFGWNFGGGLKINIKMVTFRGEVRDHLTQVGPGDLDRAEGAARLGITEDHTIHNVEISGGIGVRF